jgi:F-type H+-transporting ATPase subunit a
MRIAKSTIQFLAILLVTLLPISGFAGGSHSEDKEFNATDLINSHIGDSHEFHIADWNGHAISFYLPVILWTNNGLTVFSSSKFHHDNEGKEIVEVNGEQFVRYKEVIYYADKFAEITDEADKSGLNFAARPLNFSITKLVFSMLM